MREIKFRGKRADGKGWVEGLPVYLTEYAKDMNEIDGIQCDKTRMNYDIIPETVGQFTGLTDRKGVEIYERDIILSQGQNCKFIQSVEFHNSDKTCGRGWVGVNHVEIKLISNKEVKTSISDRFSYFSFPCSCEVIGNIFDNPELLTKTEEK